MSRTSNLEFVRDLNLVHSSSCNLPLQTRTQKILSCSPQKNPNILQDHSPGDQDNIGKWKAYWTVGEGGRRSNTWSAGKALDRRRTRGNPRSTWNTVKNWSPNSTSSFRMRRQDTRVPLRKIKQLDLGKNLFQKKCPNSGLNTGPSDELETRSDVFRNRDFSLTLSQLSY
ncbi:hypothetical protein PGT21_009113 [Puccinia graminis f. sp. tritici]|uniref:Uncharacterized protein n=1 Tax=Puccinia graminis f. sp. tritici TaxID=56615 RepID=A0A5B0N863_PUCGR|nr:hypothetical protein PGT21_009113 [Puccinia graminis f. sp. tritici]KAA1122993.1 hypothetical protein PGTUg99_015715 [Puccinia graminis f. sp. tritici]